VATVGEVPVVNNTGRGLTRQTKGTLESVVKIAKEYLGTPYSWGGGGKEGPSYGAGRGAGTKGFDCSGLLQYVIYKATGKDIGGYTQPQWNNGTKITKASQLQPGDGVFFNMGQHPETGEYGPQHVGMYIGNGLFIHSPRTGDVVKISRLSDRSDFAGGRRYI